MTSLEFVEPYLSTALKLLHSSAPDSAEKLRAMLDTEIAKTHDKSKMYGNLLTKKQLNDEKNSLGSGFKKQKPKKTEEVKVPSSQTPSEPITAVNDDDDRSSSAGSHSSAMDDLLDLGEITCVICRQMDNTSNNQLYECTDCHNLYHQLCHDPKITKETLTSWVCSTCKSKNKSSKSSRYDSPSSSSSSSSNNKKLSINLVTEKKKPEETSSSSSKKKSTEKASTSSSTSSRSRSGKK